MSEVSDSCQNIFFFWPFSHFHNFLSWVTLFCFLRNNQGIKTQTDEHIGEHIFVTNRKLKKLVSGLLHGKLGSSAVSTSSNQKCLMVNIIRIGHLSSTIYRKRFGRVPPNHFSKMAMKNVRHIFHSDISAGNLGIPFFFFFFFRKLD